MLVSELRRIHLAIEESQYPGYFWDITAKPKADWMPMGRWVSYEEWQAENEAEYRMMKRCDTKTFARWFGVKTHEAVSARRKYLLEQGTPDAHAELARLTRPVMKDDITPDMVQSARDYPVDRLIDFSRGTATAWCHEDANPSLVWWRSENRARCFPCGKTYNAIDILMDRDGYRFAEAVKNLYGKETAP